MAESMQPVGSIQYAVHSGSYILKLSGDVRLVFCTAIDALLDTILSDEKLTGVLIDLNAVSNIDSTSLGMLAKIAVKIKQKLNARPIIVSDNPDINRILEAMGFRQVFYVLDKIPIFVENKKTGGELNEKIDKIALQDMLKDIPQVDSTQQEICAKVLEAHRVLMELNSTNKETFQAVVDELEKEQRQQKSKQSNARNQADTVKPQITFNRH